MSRLPGFASCIHRFVLLAIIIGSRAPSFGAPISYVIDFTESSPCMQYSASSRTCYETPLMPQGSLNYDPELSLFTNFIVNWPGNDFDFTDSANSASQVYRYGACDGQGPGSLYALLSGHCGSPPQWRRLVCNHCGWGSNGHHSFLINFSSFFIASLTVHDQGPGDFRPGLIWESGGTFTLRAVPEPSTFWPLLILLLVLGHLKLKRTPVGRTRHYGSLAEMSLPCTGSAGRAER